MQTGKIVKVDEKGYGFIKPVEGGKDMFFHVSGLKDRAEFELLQAGDQVTFTVDNSEERPRAIDVARG